MPTSNPNPSAGSLGPVDIIAVGASTLTLRADPWAVMDYVLDTVTAMVGEDTSTTIVALPPLWAYFGASGGHDLTEGEVLRATLELRPARVLGALFTYAQAPLKRALPWLALHRGQMEFLLRVEDASRNSGLSFLGPTGLMGHPRTHWEGWPDSPHAFHYAWSFEADSPRTWSRHASPPGWLSRRGISRSRPESCGTLSVHLNRSGRPSPVHIGWGGDLTGATASHPLSWWPRIGGRGESSLMAALHQPAGWRVAVVSALDAPAAIATRDPASGAVTVNALTPPPVPDIVGPDGGAVRVARWRGRLVQG